VRDARALCRRAGRLGSTHARAHRAVPHRLRKALVGRLLDVGLASAAEPEPIYYNGSAHYLYNNR
jgi:hypothetical protein